MRGREAGEGEIVPVQERLLCSVGMLYIETKRERACVSIKWREASWIRQYSTQAAKFMSRTRESAPFCCFFFARTDYYYYADDFLQHLQLPALML